ncbi:nuclear transport factor 2 family protein [Flaviaesturariibacter aridisoli]|uniref:Nuclear transport factor 2 family protein n=1 Tax=Flaviaesturariibacter aridisoli TaxID=2545761 RepID=A0A4R4E283_9BACT|nr:nuclear transport factor 2 family protein [Flaviaesturariibacter aridisoli]TCZ69340.1 hypothetical protein E0486_12560 [Flaviaesturariibacter aridisoli]
MKRILAILTVWSATASAQSAEDSVRASVNRLFDGMRRADTTAIRAAFAPGALLQTVLVNRDGNTRIESEPADAFVSAVARPHKEVWDERITFNGVKIDGPLATVWTPYHFYAGDKFSHCGVDAFTLARLHGEWKIIYLVDTRRRTGCNLGGMQ